MNSVRQRLLNPFTTSRTFDTRSFWVYSCGLLAAFDRHCLQNVEERAPSDIENRFCQSGTGKSFDVENFKRNQVIRCTQPVSRLIVKLFTLSCNVQMQSCNFVRLIDIVFRAFLLTRRFALRRNLPPSRTQLRSPRTTHNRVIEPDPVLN